MSVVESFTKHYIIFLNDMWHMTNNNIIGELFVSYAYEVDGQVDEKKKVLVQETIMKIGQIFNDSIISVPDIFSNFKYRNNRVIHNIKFFGDNIDINLFEVFCEYKLDNKEHTFWRQLHYLFYWFNLHNKSLRNDLTVIRDNISKYRTKHDDGKYSDHLNDEDEYIKGIKMKKMTKLMTVFQKKLGHIPGRTAPSEIDISKIFEKITGMFSDEKERDELFTEMKKLHLSIGDLFSMTGELKNSKELNQWFDNAKNGAGSLVGNVLNIFAPGSRIGDDIKTQGLSLKTVASNIDSDTIKKIGHAVSVVTNDEKLAKDIETKAEEFVQNSTK